MKRTLEKNEFTRNSRPVQNNDKYAANLNQSSTQSTKVAVV